MEQVGVKDNYRLVQNLKSAGCFIVCILLTLVCLVPLYLMIVNACRGHNAILQSPVSLIPGSNFVENIPEEIKISSPDTTGYSVRNLKYMAKFAAAYSGGEFVQQPVAQIP